MGSATWVNPRSCREPVTMEGYRPWRETGAGMDDHVHRYAATCVWAGSTAAGYDTYDRAHTGTAPPAAAPLALPSDPVFRGDPRLLDPPASLRPSASPCHR